MDKERSEHTSLLSEKSELLPSRWQSPFSLLFLTFFFVVGTHLFCTVRRKAILWLLTVKEKNSHKRPGWPRDMRDVKMLFFNFFIFMYRCDYRLAKPEQESDASQDREPTVHQQHPQRYLTKAIHCLLLVKVECRGNTFVARKVDL